MNLRWSPDAEVVRRSSRILSATALDRAIAQVQLPVAVAEGSEPAPEPALVPRRLLARALCTAPLAGAVADLILKNRLYARAGISEHRLVNLAMPLVETHRLPPGDCCRIVEPHAAGETTRPHICRSRSRRVPSSAEESIDPARTPQSLRR